MRRLLLPGLCLATFACGPDLDECEALVLRECDIHEAACQDHYSDLIRCVRGDDQPTPELEVVDADTYRERWPATADDPPTADAVLLERGYQLLGLAPAAAPEPADGEAPVPAARYLFDTRTVVIVDTTDVRSQLRAIAQAHADAALGGFLAIDDKTTSSDQHTAAVALFLGETIFFGDAAWFKTRGMTDAEYTALLGSALYYGNEVADAAYVARSTAYGHLFADSSFASGYGPQAVLTAWYRGGAEAVHAAWDPPVTTTRQFIFADLAEAAPQNPDEPPPALPDGLRWLAHDNLGPWLLHAFQVREVPPGDDIPLGWDLTHAEQVATHWAGDRLLFVHDPTTDAVGIALQVVRTDSSWTPDPTMARTSSQWVTDPGGLRVTLYRAETEALRDALVDAFAAPTRSATTPPRVPSSLRAQVSRSGPGGGVPIASGDAS